MDQEQVILRQIVFEALQGQCAGAELADEIVLHIGNTTPRRSASSILRTDPSVDDR